MKQFGKPPLSTNLRISEQFFHDPPLCGNFQNKKPPSNFREGGDYSECLCLELREKYPFSVNMGYFFLMCFSHKT